MESERDHNVDHPDRLQVWEAPSHSHSPRTFNPPLGIYFRNDGKPMKSIQLGMFFL